MREKQEQRKRVTEDSIAIKITQKKWERRGKTWYCEPFNGGDEIRIKIISKIGKKVQNI